MVLARARHGQRHACARPQDAAQPGEHPQRLCDQVDDEAAGDQVVGGAGQVEPVGVHQPHVNLGMGRGEQRHHAGRRVHRGDGASAGRGCCGDRAPAAADIQQPGARIRVEHVQQLPRELGEEGNDLVVAVGETVKQRRRSISHDHDNGHPPHEQASELGDDGSKAAGSPVIESAPASTGQTRLTEQENTS